MIPAEILNDPMARAVMAANEARRAHDGTREVVCEFASREYDDSMNAARWLDAYAVGNFRQHDPCHHFCAEQNSLQARGFRIVEVATNIYGYVVRDTHNDGLGVLYGGRSRPGTTKAEAIAWARQWHAERPTHRKVIMGFEGSYSPNV